MGIHSDALYLENAFGIGPHVLTVLKAGQRTIEVENILPEGFDYNGHYNNPSRTLWRDKELIADINHSMGNEYFEKGELSSALLSYNLAIRLNPRYQKARLNKVILLDKLETDKQQEGDTIHG